MSDWTVVGLDDDLNPTAVPLQVSRIVVTQRLWRPWQVKVTVRDTLEQLPRLLPRYNWRTGQVINPDGAVLIDVQGRPYLPWYITENDRQRTVTIAGPDVGAMFDRPIVPASGSHQIATGSTTERMRAFVHAQAAGDAPSDAQVPHLVAPAPTPAGPAGRSEERFSILSDVLERLGKLAGIGYDVTLDGDDIVWAPRVGESIPDVELSARRKTATNVTRETDDREIVTTAIVAGQGEGEARTIVTRGGAAAGWFRRAVFIDARDTDDTDTLEDRGDEAIAESDRPERWTVEVADPRSAQFGVAYRLGDVVTVRNARAASEQQIVEAKVTVAGGEARSIELGISRPLPTTVDRDPRSAPATSRT